MWPQGRTSPGPGSRGLRLLISGSMWYQLCSAETLQFHTAPTHPRSQNPFFGLTSTFQRIPTGTGLCWSNKPTPSLPSSNKYVLKRWDLGQGSGTAGSDPGTWVHPLPLELPCPAWRPALGSAATSKSSTEAQEPFSTLPLPAAEKCFWRFNQDSQWRCPETIGYS